MMTSKRPFRFTNRCKTAERVFDHQSRNDSIFPGVPRIESPVFNSDPLVDLTEAETVVARDLHRQGFAVIDFPDPELDDRFERIKANFGTRSDIPFDGSTADKTKAERRVQDAWQFDADAKAIASNPRILKLLSNLNGHPAFPFQTLNFPVGTQQRSPEGAWLILDRKSYIFRSPVSG
jgi:hypothetical protein